MKLIPLSQGRSVKPKIQHYAMVDDEDFEWLNQWRWQALKSGYTFYAVRRGNELKRPTIIMHRLILGLEPGDGKIGDHKDRSGLNNQRGNLRIATKAQNCSNCHIRKKSTSKYLGVSKEMCKRKKNIYWRVDISVNRKKIYGGQFKSEELAALRYNELALFYKGEFANLNIIE